MFKFQLKKKGRDELEYLVSKNRIPEFTFPKIINDREFEFINYKASSARNSPTKKTKKVCIDERDEHEKKAAAMWGMISNSVVSDIHAENISTIWQNHQYE